MIDPELRNAAIAFFVVVLSGAGAYIGGWLQNRSQREKQRTEFERQKAVIEAEAEAQNAKNQEAIRQTLANYVNQIGRLDTDLRDVRTRLSKAQDDLNTATRKLNEADANQKTFKSNLEAAEETIKQLGETLLKKEEESRQRDKIIEDLQKGHQSTNARLDAVLKERDDLQKQLVQRDEAHAKELTQRDAKIEQMQARLDKLEKKDTDKLDETKVPPSDPADPAAGTDVTPPEA